LVKSSVTSLKDLQRSTRRNKYITFKASKTNLSDVADPLVEPYDMTIVTSPCHTWEPIKVREGHVGPMHLSGLWCGILDVIDQAPIATQRSSSCCESHRAARGVRPSGLLDDSGRTGVRPDSVQASGGVLSLRLPTLLLVWLFFGLRSRRAPREVWLQRGLLSS